MLPRRAFSSVSSSYVPAPSRAHIVEDHRQRHERRHVRRPLRRQRGEVDALEERVVLAIAPPRRPP